MIPTGPEALGAYERAKALVKDGKHDEALAVEMQPSDRGLIEKQIAAAKHVPGAKGTAE